MLLVLRGRGVGQAELLAPLARELGRGDFAWRLSDGDHVLAYVQHRRAPLVRIADAPRQVQLVRCRVPGDPTKKGGARAWYLGSLRVGAQAAAHRRGRAGGGDGRRPTQRQDEVATAAPLDRWNPYHPAPVGDLDPDATATLASIDWASAHAVNVGAGLNEDYLVARLVQLVRQREAAKYVGLWARRACRARGVPVSNASAPSTEARAGGWPGWASYLHSAPLRPGSRALAELKEWQHYPYAGFAYLDERGALASPWRIESSARPRHALKRCPGCPAATWASATGAPKYFSITKRVPLRSLYDWARNDELFTKERPQAAMLCADRARLHALLVCVCVYGLQPTEAVRQPPSAQALRRDRPRPLGARATAVWATDSRRAAPPIDVDIRAGGGAGVPSTPGQRSAGTRAAECSAYAPSAPSPCGRRARQRSRRSPRTRQSR